MGCQLLIQSACHSRTRPMTKPVQNIRAFHLRHYASLRSRGLQRTHTVQMRLRTQRSAKTCREECHFSRYSRPPNYFTVAPIALPSASRRQQSTHSHSTPDVVNRHRLHHGPSRQPRSHLILHHDPPTSCSGLNIRRRQQPAEELPQHRQAGAGDGQDALHLGPDGGSVAGVEDVLVTSRRAAQGRVTQDRCNHNDYSKQEHQ